MPEINSGLLIIDKPAGMSSARVVSILKKLSGAKKAGHTGTLDPFATGVLLCCINEATKISRFFLGGNKKYRARLCLGIETDTQDFTGKIISVCRVPDFTDKEIQQAFKKFEGFIEQLPPAYSALKHKGVPLYRLARNGLPVQKPARKIQIFDIKIIETGLPEIVFEVSCSGGTYIRTLCADIGRLLGCGGHLKELRRIESCGFGIREALTIEEIEKLASDENLQDRLISMSDALLNMPVHTADDILTEKISCGKKITERDLFPDEPDGADNFIKIVNKDDDLLAVLSKTGDKYDYCCVINRIFEYSR
ncbi:MAG: tRNA pseudouridine55 synthase [Thermodesulfobacteriota bacterium]|nr:tRNA pseudouridine55 synthase [Thermodesulfobacteriota bacterium]